MSITHSAGAISVSTGGVGIKAEVGAARQEANAMHADYVAPMNAGLAKIAVTGGSVTSKGNAVQAVNYEAGSVEISVSRGVALTSTHGHGIEAWLADVGNTAGTITVTNAATIAAGTTVDGPRHGISVYRAAGSGDVEVTNSGTVTASGYGIFAVAKGAGGDVEVTNSGEIGTAGDRVVRGIFSSHEGTSGSLMVTNSGAIKTNGEGIFAKTTGKDGSGADAGVTVAHSAGAIESADERGIKAHVGEARQETDADRDGYVAPRNKGLVKVEVTGGSIESKWEPIQAFNYEAGSVEISVSKGVTLTSEHGHGIVAGLTDVGNANGTITVNNAGTIRAPRHGLTFAVEAGSGDMTVTNSGALEVDGSGIFVVGRRTATGDMTVTNSGAIGKEDARAFGGIFASHDSAGATGAVEVANSGDIMAKYYGILAQTKFQDVDGAKDGVTVTHSAGAINVADDAAVNSDKQGIVARVGNWRQETDAGHGDYVAPKNKGLVKIDVTGGSIAAKGSAVEGANYEAGSVEINVFRGVTLTSTHEHGIEADLRDVGNAGGTIAITQAGTVSAGGNGISAKVARVSAADEERTASARPLIDVAWTGTFTALEGKRGSPRNVALAVEAAAVEAVRGQREEEGRIRFAQGSAGIDAGVMKWKTFMRPVSEGDDPGAFADKAAQDALFAADADAATKARAAAIVAQFRSVLANEALGTIPGAAAIDDDDDGSYSDDELVAYLSEDDDARRTLLRNVLAQSFTEREVAVFRAVISGGDVEAALAAAPASYTDAWKDGVRELLKNHNVGNVRIAVNGGSIVSRGDGIRAYYGLPHENNGTIAVTVAEGASVIGGAAGIYVSGAGTGLRVEKKYTSQDIQNANEDLLPDAQVTLEDHLNQVVRVQGTVTGGTDAAVHLDGGGALIVTGAGKLVAGSSGLAVLVNDPGPAVIYIDGEVTGGEGPEDAPAPAAVHLTGGGSVTIGLTGRVRAGGAMRAIGGSDDAPPVAVIIHTESPVDTLSPEQAREGLGRVEGGFGPGIPEITFAEFEDGAPTGFTEKGLLPVDDEQGTVDLRGLRFSCDGAADGRCRLYEALPSILLAMNGLPTYGERTSAARDGTGAWARVETAGGEWTADRSTRAKVAYDYGRHGVRTGADVAVGENARLGASVHGFRGDAKVASSGEAKLWGMGAGVHATTALDGFYADAQAAATWYEVDLKSPIHGPLKNEAKGRGYAVGVEVGRRVPASDGVSVTPRVGLAWSDVSLKDFTDGTGSGAEVSVKAAESLTGRVGASVEAETGDGLRLFGSVDVTHEFSEETEAAVSGTALKASAERTTVRVGVGGSLDLGNGASLRGSAGYAVGGGGNRAFSGGLGMAVRF